VSQPLNITIRQATKADVEPLAEISNRTIRADYAPFLTASAVDQYIASGAVNNYLQQNIDQCAVILTDDQLVGCSIAIENRIDLLLIDHDFHRRGLGSRLLAHCEESLFKHHDRLTLESFEPNHKANNFYRKHGWGETSRYFDETSGVDKLVFHKPA
jgi:ribosomal protein S18 acetylase RimI-like enzyme